MIPINNHTEIMKAGGMPLAWGEVYRLFQEATLRLEELGAGDWWLKIIAKMQYGNMAITAMARYKDTRPKEVK